MTINTKDNIEYAAALLWFINHPWFKALESDSPYNLITSVKCVAYLPMVIKKKTVYLKVLKLTDKNGSLAFVAIKEEQFRCLEGK